MNNELKSSTQLILDAVGECTAAFRLGDDTLAYKKIIEIIEKMQDFLKILSSKDTPESTIISMNSILLQISEAISNRDSILLPDLLEFELVPIIEDLNNSK